jgi:hypothetical protein
VSAAYPRCFAAALHKATMYIDGCGQRSIPDLLLIVRTFVVASCDASMPRLHVLCIVATLLDK